MQVDQRVGQRTPRGSTRPGRGGLAAGPLTGPQMVPLLSPNLGVTGPRPWVGVGMSAQQSLPCSKVPPLHPASLLPAGPVLALYCALIDTKYRFPISRAVMV